MKEEQRRRLAEHLASHIENSHRGYEWPSSKYLADYIYCGFRDYEYQHQDQKIQIVKV